MDIRPDILALCAIAAVALWMIYRRDRARKRARRDAYLEDCRSLVANGRLKKIDPHYPVLEGRYAGHDVKLEPIVDHMGVRKLPSLWLKVSVFGNLPIPGTVDFLARPLNTEFFSPSASLAHTLRIPPHWPQHALLHTDIDDEAVALGLLRPHMSLFNDLKMKELVIAPRGVRLVYQANQGERAYYMVLRLPEFGEARLPVALARRLLDEAIAVYNSVAAASAGSGHEIAGGEKKDRAV